MLNPPNFIVVIKREKVYNQGKAFAFQTAKASLAFAKPSKPSKLERCQMGFNGRKGRLEVLGHVRSEDSETFEPEPHEEAQVAVASPPPPKGAKRGRKSAAEKAALADAADTPSIVYHPTPVPPAPGASSVPKAFKRR